MNNAISCWIISNSPGELSNWVSPVCHALSKLDRPIETQLFLTPCPFASGTEINYAKTLPTIVAVHPPQKTLLVALKGDPDLKPEQGVILFLGGDPMYAKRIHKHYPHLKLLAYTESRITDKAFDRVYTRSEGDLMASRVRYYQPQGRDQVARQFGLDPAQKYAVLFTGSRPRFFRAQYPFMLKIAESLHTLSPVLVISPFISDELLAEVQAKHPTHFPLLRSDESLAFFELADFLVTIPGSSTAEALYTATPMMMILPLNYPETLIFDGLLGLLAHIPGLSYILRKFLIWKFQRTQRFYAIPNILAQKEVVPERVGILDPKTLAKDIETHHEHAPKIRATLKAIPRPDCIAQKIAADIAGYF